MVYGDSKALPLVINTWIQSSFLGPYPSSDQFEFMAFITVSMVLICGVFLTLLFESCG
jgi:hypothetical protein